MDNYLTGERIANQLTAKNVEFEQKKMFGGLCFLVENKMLMGTYKGGIMVRVDLEEAKTLINRPGASQMIHGGRMMAGYLIVEPEGYDSDSDLSFWVEKCLAFNPKAKASRKK